MGDLKESDRLALGISLGVALYLLYQVNDFRQQVVTLNSILQRYQPLLDKAQSLTTGG